MIIAITEFNLRPDTSRSEVTELYQRSAKAWVKNKDLVQKYYFYDEANCRCSETAKLDRFWLEFSAVIPRGWEERRR